MVQKFKAETHRQIRVAWRFRQHTSSPYETYKNGPIQTPTIFVFLYGPSAHFRAMASPPTGSGDNSVFTANQKGHGMCICAAPVQHGRPHQQPGCQYGRHHQQLSCQHGRHHQQLGCQHGRPHKQLTCQHGRHHKQLGCHWHSFRGTPIIR
jgi:hypothetical protein